MCVAVSVSVSNSVSETSFETKSVTMCITMSISLCVSLYVSSVFGDSVCHSFAMLSFILSPSGPHACTPSDSLLHGHSSVIFSLQ